MCELGVFHIFLENDLLKVDKILGLTFFKASTVLEGFNTRYYTAFFNLLELSFVLDGLFSHHFCQHFMRRTTQQTLLVINLACQQKTTKLYFSSQVRKQFKLLAFPFKPLSCCLRNDKLVNCHV